MRRNGFIILVSIVVLAVAVFPSLFLSVLESETNDDFDIIILALFVTVAAGMALFFAIRGYISRSSRQPSSLDLVTLVAASIAALAAVTSTLPLAILSVIA